jgi:hypothetical protein
MESGARFFCFLHNVRFVNFHTVPLPARDFPTVPRFNEDSVIIAGLNPFSGELEALPSELDKAARTVTTPYTKYFDTWVLASRASLVLDVTPLQRRLLLSADCREWRPGEETGACHMSGTGYTDESTRPFNRTE